MQNQWCGFFFFHCIPYTPLWEWVWHQYFNVAVQDSAKYCKQANCCSLWKLLPLDSSDDIKAVLHIIVYILFCWSRWLIVYCNQLTSWIFWLWVHLQYISINELIYFQLLAQQRILLLLWLETHIKFDDNLIIWKVLQLPQQVGSTASHMNLTKVLVQVIAVIHLACTLSVSSVKH